MSGRVFVDTNILIYAHDIDAGKKHGKAARILVDLWQSRMGVMSTQVLQEFYVNVTRKIPNPLERKVARDVVRQYSVWPIVSPDIHTIVRASEIEERYSLSFWDALIVAASREAGAERLLTEDLKDGETIDGVLVENPFAGKTQT